jgi:hypothetical protein
MRQFKKFVEVIEIDDATHRNSIGVSLRFAAHWSPGAHNYRCNK